MIFTRNSTLLHLKVVSAILQSILDTQMQLQSSFKMAIVSVDETLSLKNFDVIDQTEVIANIVSTQLPTLVGVNEILAFGDLQPHSNGIIKFNVIMLNGEKNFMHILANHLNYIGAADVTVIFISARMSRENHEAVVNLLIGRGQIFVYTKYLGLIALHGYNPIKLFTIIDENDANSAILLLSRAPTASSIYGAHVNVFVWFLPPRTLIVPTKPDTYILTGDDPFVLSTFKRIYNITTSICTDGTFEGLFSLYYGYKRYEEVKTIHPRVLLTNNQLSEFNLSVTSARSDIHLSAYYIVNSDKTSFDYLYPHKLDCLRVLVPNRNQKVSVLLRVMRNGEIQCIILVYLMFVAYKFIVQKIGPPEKRLTLNAIWFRTIGLCLAQTNSAVTKSHRLELIWNVGMLLFSVATPVILAGAIFQHLVVDVNVANINTLKELEALNVTIKVADFLQDNGSFWLPHLNPTLANMVELHDMSYLLKIIYEDLNGSANVIFAIQQSRLPSFYVWMHNSKPIQFDDPVYHVIDEPIFCSLTANRVLPNSQFAEPMSKLRRQLFETGLAQIFSVWIDRFFIALRTPQIMQLKPDSRGELTFRQLSGIFNMYLIGMISSAFVFGIEMVWKKQSIVRQGNK